MIPIALAQTTSGDDFAANLSTACALVAGAARDGARLLAFPEVFLYVGPRAGKLRHAQRLDGPVIGRFRELAARHGLMLLLGSVHEIVPADATRVFNTSVLIGADGAVLAQYRKLRLFDADLPNARIRESDTVAPGVEPPPVVTTPIGRVGLTVCFDLRFSELFRSLSARAADLVFVPSNFTVPTGRAHWEVLLRARAIEGQFFVAAPAQSGRHSDGSRSFGHSMVVDPWGRVLAVKPTGRGLVMVALDPELPARVRAQIPMGHGRSARGGDVR